jgi:methyl-accepting chemotaxis protein
MKQEGGDGGRTIMVKSIRSKWGSKNFSVFGKIIFGYCIISVMAVAIVGWVTSSLMKSSKRFTSFSSVSRNLSEVTLPHNNVAYELIDKFTEVSTLFSTAIAEHDQGPLASIQEAVKAIGSSVTRSIPSGKVDPELVGVLSGFNRYAEKGMDVVSRFLSDTGSVDLTEISHMGEEISALKARLAGFQASRSEILRAELSDMAQSADELQRQNSFLIRGTLIISVISLVAAVLISWAIASSIASPVARVVELSNAMAKGDLSQRLDMSRRDEIGNMATALDDSCKNLSEMIRQIRDNADMLAGSSEEMSVVATEMASSADEMTSQAGTAEGATEEMSANINAIATATEQMSANVHTVSSTAEEMSRNVNAVASSVEQMSMTLNDVAAGVRKGLDTAGRATETSESATKTMSLLGKAAVDIGEVTALIKRIAEQTNLLALNATIEAASAGDAGKGFAVVANEIKELAHQSGQAAEDISRRIQGVQANTQEAVKAIADVSEIINSMNESSGMIAKSVEQQKAMANEIAGNIRQTSMGVNDIASSIAETSQGANDIANSAAEAARGVTAVSSNVQQVSKAAGVSNAGARKVTASAGKLAKMAGQLQEMVGRFKV